MFNIGGPEVLVIALVALIVVGPEQLPGVLRKAGQYASQVRSMTTGLRDEFMAGVDEVNPVKWSEDAAAASAAKTGNDGPEDASASNGSANGTTSTPIVPKGYADRVAANDPDNPFQAKPVSGQMTQADMGEPTPAEAAAEAAAAADKAERAAQSARAEANRARARAKAAAAEAAEGADDAMPDAPTSDQPDGAADT